MHPGNPVVLETQEDDLNNTQGSNGQDNHRTESDEYEQLEKCPRVRIAAAHLGHRNREKQPEHFLFSIRRRYLPPVIFYLANQKDPLDQQIQVQQQQNHRHQHEVS